MSQYSIEARSLDLPGPYSHNFWVLRDQDGKALAELHGLATDRVTGKTVPIGTDERLHSLRVRHFPLDADYAQSLGMKQSKGGYIAEGQDAKTVLTADKEEVMGRWNAAVASKTPLNALDLDYPSYGFKMFSDTVNSNSTYRTLGEIMGVHVHDFSGVMEPGLDNRMVSPETIKELRTHDYPVLKEPAVKEGERYKVAEAERSATPDRRADAAAPQRDARNVEHPGHGDYVRIREGLAASLANDPQRLEQIASAAYRASVDNPLVHRVDYAGMHNGHAVATYAPHGLGREPMFNASVPLAQAERETADTHMVKANDSLALAQQQAQAETQRQQTPAAGGPSLSIGARNA
jgi:hypothetical protein